MPHIDFPMSSVPDVKLGQAQSVVGPGTTFEFAQLIEEPEDAVSDEPPVENPDQPKVEEDVQPNLENVVEPSASGIFGQSRTVELSSDKNKAVFGSTAVDKQFQSKAQPSGDERESEPLFPPSGLKFIAGQKPTPPSEALTVPHFGNATSTPVATSTPSTLPTQIQEAANRGASNVIDDTEAIQLIIPRRSSAKPDGNGVMDSRLAAQINPLPKASSAQTPNLSTPPTKESHKEPSIGRPVPTTDNDSVKPARTEQNNAAFQKAPSPIGSFQSLETNKLFNLPSLAGTFEGAVSDIKGSSAIASSSVPTSQQTTPSQTHQVQSQAPSASSQIVAAIARSDSGVTEIRLNPEELGRVRIALTPTETGLSVAILADRPETADLLRRNLDVLAQDFKDIGYQDLMFEFSDSQENATDDGGQDPEAEQTYIVSGSPSLEGPLDLPAAKRIGLDLKL